VHWAVQCASMCLFGIFRRLSYCDVPLANKVLHSLLIEVWGCSADAEGRRYERRGQCGWLEGPGRAAVPEQVPNSASRFIAGGDSTIFNIKEYIFWGPLRNTLAVLLAMCPLL
jgi:hypothetical protein